MKPSFYFHFYFYFLFLFTLLTCFLLFPLLFKLCLFSLYIFLFLYIIIFTFSFYYWVACGQTSLKLPSVYFFFVCEKMQFLRKTTYMVRRPIYGFCVLGLALSKSPPWTLSTSVEISVLLIP